MLYVCDKKLLSSSICNKCGNEDEKYFKVEKSINIFKNFVLIDNMYKYPVQEENLSQEFKLKNIERTKNYLIIEIDQNVLVSNKDKRITMTLYYIEHFLILASVITGCLSISAFASSLGIPIEIRNRIKNLRNNEVFKKHKPITKKKKHIKIVLLANSELNSMEAFIFKSLNYSYSSHNENVSVNDVPKEFDEMKQEIRNLRI